MEAVAIDNQTQTIHDSDQDNPTLNGKKDLKLDIQTEAHDNAHMIQLSTQFQIKILNFQV